MSIARKRKRAVGGTESTSPAQLAWNPDRESDNSRRASGEEEEEEEEEDFLLLEERLLRRRSNDAERLRIDSRSLLEPIPVMRIRHTQLFHTPHFFRFIRAPTLPESEDPVMASPPEEDEAAFAVVGGRFPATTNEGLLLATLGFVDGVGAA